MYHPFWVIDGEELSDRRAPRELQPHESEGLSLPGRWVNSHELQAGDVVLSQDGRKLRVLKLEQEYQEFFPVSNLTIENDHNFAVGPDAVLVHNTGGCRVTDDDFVRFDPSSFDSSIDRFGINSRFFQDGKVWLTKYRHVKHIASATDLETVLYRQNLWSQTAGKFRAGATLRVVNNVTDATAAGLTNTINGVPQWRILRDISPEELKKLWQLE